MHPLELPARRLPQQTEANLHVAIATVARILGVGEVPEYVLNYLMDDIADGLTKQQRRDPLAALSPEVLGRIQDRVKLSYGLGQPVNIHGAPAPKVPGHPEADADAAGNKDRDAFKRNRFGETDWDYLARATSSARYRDIDPRHWDPSTGATGLTNTNFGSTDFARAGLDLPTTQFLFGQGFSMPQILHAGQDAKALGLNTRDPKLVENFATLDRFDPAGRDQRQKADQAYAAWAEQNKDDINRRIAAVKATEPGTAAHAAAVADLDQIMQQGYIQTGQAAVDQRIKTVPAAPGSKPDDRTNSTAAQGGNRQAILKDRGVNADAVDQLGLGASYAQNVPGGTSPAPSSAAPPASKVPTTSVQRSDGDPDETPRRLALSTLTKKAAEATAAADDFFAAGDLASNAPAGIAATAPAPPPAQTQQVASADVLKHPGKEEDDKVAAQPKRPQTDVASAASKPTNPTV